MDRNTARNSGRVGFGGWPWEGPSMFIPLSPDWTILDPSPFNDDYYVRRARASARYHRRLLSQWEHRVWVQMGNLCDDVDAPNRDRSIVIRRSEEGPYMSASWVATLRDRMAAAALRCPLLRQAAEPVTDVHHKDYIGDHWDFEAHIDPHSIRIVQVSEGRNVASCFQQIRIAPSLVGYRNFLEIQLFVRYPARLTRTASSE